MTQEVVAQDVERALVDGKARVPHEADRQLERLETVQMRRRARIAKAGDGTRGIGVQSGLRRAGQSGGTCGDVAKAGAAIQNERQNDAVELGRKDNARLKPHAVSRHAEGHAAGGGAERREVGASAPFGFIETDAVAGQVDQQVVIGKEIAAEQAVERFAVRSSAVQRGDVEVDVAAGGVADGQAGNRGDRVRANPADAVDDPIRLMRRHGAGLHDRRAQDGAIRASINQQGRRTVLNEDRDKRHGAVGRELGKRVDHASGGASGAGGKTQESSKHGHGARRATQTVHNHKVASPVFAEV